MTGSLFPHLALSHAVLFLVKVIEWDPPDQLDPLPQFPGPSALSTARRQQSSMTRHKAHNSMHNISRIMHKLCTHGPSSWAESATVIKLFTETFTLQTVWEWKSWLGNHMHGLTGHSTPHVFHFFHDSAGNPVIWDKAWILTQ